MTDTDPRMEAVASTLYSFTSVSPWLDLTGEQRISWRNAAWTVLEAVDAVDPLRAEDFGALVGLVEKIVDTHYPAGTFTGASGDRGARFVAALHRALADLDPEDP